MVGVSADEGCSVNEVQITINPVGQGTVFVDGQDISTIVSGVQIQAEHGQVTQVYLKVRPGMTVQVEGVAEVAADNPESKTTLLRLLSTVDTDRLDKKIMAAADWGDETTMTQQVIAALKEEIGGT